MHSSILCILGPTASGKTQLALNLAEHAAIEIISVDSAMVYRGLDIGTAKPEPSLLKKIPHHLIDICDPSEVYSAGRFCEAAVALIQDIQGRQKIPILVGGTMLYFRALQTGLSDLPHADPLIRQKIEEEANELGWGILHARLQKIDPIAAERIKPNDAQRIQRALELYEQTGKSITTLHAQRNKQHSYSFSNVILMPPDRAKLHQKIAERFDQMLEQGLIAEVERLYQRSDLHPDLPALRTVGYRQIWRYLSGEINSVEMREQAIAATRQLAKRQLTWLRQWDAKDYYSSEDRELLQKVLRRLGGCE